MEQSSSTKDHLKVKNREETKEPQEQKKKIPTHIHAISGTFSGGFATFVTHPLDLVKTRLQVQVQAKNQLINGMNQQQQLYQGTIDAFRKIFRHDGIRGLYQGLSPSLIGSASAWGFYFFSYEICKNNIQKIPGLDSPGPGTFLSAGIAAGIATAFVTNPIWVVKTRMQLQTLKGEGNYNGFIDAMRTIGKEEGFRGYYKGFIPALFGTTHGALQFMAYEEMKKFAFRNHPDTPLSKIEVGLISGSSKIFAVVVTYPYQVIKSRLQERPAGNQAKYNGVIDVCRKIIRNEGFHGFYKGLFPNLLKVTPAAVITFITYETVVRHLTSLEGV
eukprot:TRINITY_DN1335_c0_g1_i2.p1 TRINITY_DN1335_c0_g1~~TRINITY_DN1335_c0_g1_i2.p1  ORF type:complete len:330 (+),score=71.26 TRINITY_DN1335_c0_g1_i2:54-1043(+)